MTTTVQRAEPPAAPPAPKKPLVVKRVAASGMRWIALGHGCRMLTHLTTTAVLALVLQPADFGLVGMAMVVVAFAQLLRDPGTGAAVVHRRDLEDVTLSTLFWANALLGAAATAGVFMLASPIAAFFGAAGLAPLLRLLACSLLLASLGVVHQSLLQRDLRFKTLARIEITALVFGAATGITAALLGAGAFSLILQTLLTSAIHTALCLARCPWRPAARFEPRRLRGIARYSLSLSAFNILHWGTRNLDQILIGRFLGATALGHYAIALRLLLYPLQGVSTVVGKVMFPLFVEIGDDEARFQHAYLKVTGAVGLLLFPVLVGLMVVAGPLVQTLLGARWGPVVPLIALLAVVGLVQSVLSGVGGIYQARGRTDLMLLWGLVTALTVAIACSIGLQWQTVGVAAAYAILAVLLLLPGLWLPLRLIGLRLSELGRHLWRPALATLAMAVATCGLQLALPAAWPAAARLTLLVGAGGASYGLATWLWNRSQAMEVTRAMLQAGTKE